MPKRVRVLISGRVQGVFFRAFIKDNAKLLNLRGYVKNTVDGNVEALLEGKKENINKMIELCKKGSRFSRVDNVKVKEEECKGNYKDFGILY